MLMPNDIVTVGEAPPVRLKVIAAETALDMVALVKLPVGDTAEEKALLEKQWPIVVTMAEATEYLSSGFWLLGEPDHPIRPDDRDLPEGHLKRREASWAIVGPLIARTPDVFVKMKRSRLVAEASDLHGMSPVHIKALLRRCFHRGMDEGAMLPDFANCGAPGVGRVEAQGRAKPGPARKDGKPGVMITPDIKACFLNAYESFRSNRKLSLHDAYIQCLRMYFTDIVEDPGTGAMKRIPKAEYALLGLPQFDQFAYHVRKEVNRRDADLQRFGRKWTMKNRRLLGNSTMEAWGPGARYQIDATVIDCYIRSKRNRARLIHRPTLYVIIDVFSRMIVGFFISEDPPSWSTAMMALATVVEDKVALCKRHGVDITPEDWPTRAFCSILEGDKGELIAVHAESIVKRFGATIENAAAYRADWKGIVESRFRILQWGFRPMVDGYVEKDFGERGAKDYRRAARLTIDELTRIVISLILRHNNSKQLTGYPRLPEMTDDGVPSVPRELWNWGVANMIGTRRTFKEDLFRFALMPRDTAMVTREGIKHRGYLYTCDKAISEGWFERAAEKTFSVPISFHPRDPAEILIHVSKAEGEYQVARFTRPMEYLYHDMSHAEIEVIREKAAVIAATAKEAELLGRMESDDRIEAEVAAARQAFDDCEDPDGIKNDTKGLVEAKAEERASSIGAVTAEFRSKFEGSGATPAPGGATPTTATVVDIATRRPTPSKRKSLAERLREEG
ncbi:Mu transposase C-terminal domain-containing protein [Sphingomonas sp. AR_OL41]|uniref:Mu transposase C-terminal domain-containing protein n=1 Tax=Sphingomonas sp. AR_OL41 TaxID=3042729 RepID=UPI00248074BD|nr:Mu transposase C-terminal domain-containing protein [Sphingomonas sp. AR_OL41]MDH7973045.1 Mu transposase C-terminal domain-containing protein [Sphingomonas sp. AR_OL41]